MLRIILWSDSEKYKINHILHTSVYNGQYLAENVNTEEEKIKRLLNYY